MRAADVAWAAGLFEGEGCLHLSRTDYKGTDYARAVAVVTMTDEDIVRRFHMIVGVGRIYRPQRREGRKPQWRWQVADKAGFAEFTALIEPWLGVRRLAKLTEIRAVMPPLRLGDKLTADEVAAIRATAPFRGIDSALARQYGVNRSHIFRIRTGARR